MPLLIQCARFFKPPPSPFFWSILRSFPVNVGLIKMYVTFCLCCRENKGWMDPQVKQDPRGRWWGSVTLLMHWSLIWRQTDDFFTCAQGPAGLAGLKGDPGKKGEKVHHTHTHTQSKCSWFHYICVCVRVMAVWLVWLGRRVSSERKVIEDCRETRGCREPKETRWTHTHTHSYRNTFTHTLRSWLNRVSADRDQSDLQDSVDRRDYQDCLWVSRHFNPHTHQTHPDLLGVSEFVLVSQLLSVTLCFRDPWDRKDLKETRWNTHWFLLEFILIRRTFELRHVSWVCSRICI